jgi:hypothetical protein
MTIRQVITRFRGMGIAALTDTAREEKSKLRSIYLDLVGFAVHPSSRPKSTGPSLSRLTSRSLGATW